jgi:hypothetical protein
MAVSDLLDQPCNKSDNIKQGCYKLLTVYSKLVDNLGQALRRQLVGRLATRCETFACVIDMHVAPKIWKPRDQHSPGSLPPARSVEKRAWMPFE